MARQAKSGSVPHELRAQGRLIATFERTPDGGTKVASLEEGGGYRLRFTRPRSSPVRRAGAALDGIGACEGSVVNTGGGMAGGDRLSVAIDAGRATDVLLSTSAAERIYRSTGRETDVDIDLRLGARARLVWVPQETILFSCARLRRRLSVDMHESATLIAAETVIFGRLAMGESLGKGLFIDRWRIRRGGRLVHAEDTSLDGHIGRLLDRPAIGDGARAIATAIVVAPDAEDRLEAFRARMRVTLCEWGASAWKGRLIARFLAKDPVELRAALVCFLLVTTGGRLPRLWAAADRDLPTSIRQGVDGSPATMQEYGWDVRREAEVEPNPT
jgi:urease accessory protein